MLKSLQKMDEVQFWENSPFSGVMPEPRRCKPEDTRKTIKKKAKRIRTAYTTEQIRALELLFVQNKYITTERRREISKTLKIGDKSVKIWFQNRRMKEKRESSESSSDSSSENVTDSESVTPTTKTEFPNSVQSNGMDSLLSPDVNHGILSPDQYQVPSYFNYNIFCEQQNLNFQTSDYTLMQNNYTQYYNESNMYPTEYYPCNNDNYNYTNEYNNYFNSQHEYVMHNMQNGYWNANGDASCYFYN